MIHLAYIYSVVYVLFCILGALVLYKLGLPKKFTRKFIHILVGFVWLILYNFTVDSRVHFLIICAVFTILLYIDYKVKLLPHMSSDSSNDPGTVYYGVSMTVMAAVCMFVPQGYLPFGISVFVTSFGDGFAGVVGQSIKKHNPVIYGDKSIFGTAANFIITFAVVTIFDHCYSMGLGIPIALALAFLAAEIELISGRGLDNIFLSLGIFGMTLLAVLYPPIVNCVVPIVFTPFVIFAVCKSGTLTLWGTIAAVVTDIAVSVAFGNMGFVVLISFFVLSLFADKIKEKAKKQEQNAHVSTKLRMKKGRNAAQVFANGGIGILCAVLFLITNNRVFMIAYVAVMAEALADTAASGIGAYSQKVFDPFRMKACEKGLSGGMSVIGTFAALIAAVVIPLIAMMFGEVLITEALLICLIAFLGMIFDSFLGSLFQAKYVCPVCGRTVEKSIHCEKPTTLCRGFRFVNNSTVNFISTVFSFVLAVAVFSLL